MSKPILSNSKGWKRKRPSQSPTVLPSVSAGTGPFTLVDPKALSPTYGGITGTLSSGERVFGVPKDSTASSMAIRAHEYGHLALERIKAMKPGELEKAGISPSWSNAVTDVVVNHYMMGVGVREVEKLPLEPLGVKSMEELGERPYLGVQEMLRSSGIEAANPRLEREVQNLRTSFPKRELELVNHELVELRDIAAKLAYGDLSGPEANKRIFKRARNLQALFGSELAPKPLPTGKPGAGSGSGTTPGGVVAPTSMEFLSESRIKWGKMSIIDLPLTGVRKVKRRLKTLRKDYMGGFRFPLHALIPAFDGKCFAVKRRVKGGAVLVDLSGSMGVDNEVLSALLSVAPASIVAGYSSKPGGPHAGVLGVMAENGSAFDTSDREEYFGGGNVVDGPALDWLAQQAGPKVWVSDGGVTGIGDHQTHELILDAAVKVKEMGAIQVGSLTEAVELLSQQ